MAASPAGSPVRAGMHSPGLHHLHGPRVHLSATNPLRVGSLPIPLQIGAKRQARASPSKFKIAGRKPGSSAWVDAQFTASARIVKGSSEPGFECNHCGAVMSATNITRRKKHLLNPGTCGSSSNPSRGFLNSAEASKFAGIQEVAAALAAVSMPSA